MRGQITLASNNAKNKGRNKNEHEKSRDLTKRY